MTRALIVLCAAALVLGSCGKRGELQRPGPMFDVPAKAALAK